MTTQKFEFSKVPNSQGGHYYAPPFEIDKLPVINFVKLERLEKKKTEEREKLISAFSDRISGFLAELKNVRDEDVETWKKERGQSTLQELIKAFEVAQKRLTENFDGKALWDLVKNAKEAYSLSALSGLPKVDPRTNEDFASDMSYEQKSTLFGRNSSYEKNRTKVWDALERVNKGFESLFDNFNYAENDVETEKNTINSNISSHFKVLLDREFKKAIKEIQEEANQANLQYRTEYGSGKHPGIDMLCCGIIFSPYKDSPSGVSDKIADIVSLKNWQTDILSVRPFIEKIQAIHTAYLADLKKIPELVRKFAQPKDKIFLEELREFPAFKALMDRIPEIQKRINIQTRMGDAYFWQDKDKNENKRDALLELSKKVTADKPSLQDIYDFIKRNQTIITQSTRSDDGYTATWFRSTPESADLLPQVLAKFDDTFPDLGATYEKKNTEMGVNLPSSSSSSTSTSSANKN